MSTMAENLLVVDDLKKHFTVKAGTVVRAVDGVNLTLAPGETVGLVGESGSGKSTVAYTVMGMYGPTSGRVMFKGQDIGRVAAARPRSVKKDLQIVFQDPGSSLNRQRTLGQILELPLKVHTKLNKSQRNERIAELLEMVELPADYMYKYPHALSGGERQLVGIARSLATDPSVIVLDEPTSALDVSVQAKVINMLIRFQQQMQLAYLFITHDLSLMRNVAHRVAIMYLGKTCEFAPTEEFFRSPLHPYTRMLLSAIPVASEAEERVKPRKIISTGEIPSPVNIPPGCSFHTRCPAATEQCRRSDPEMREIRPGHWVRCHFAEELASESA